MSEPIIISVVSILAIAIVTIAMLKGWQDWLALKQRELDRAPSPRREIEADTFGSSAVGGARIEIADLKERIRKLEAIASGVDL